MGLKAGSSPAKQASAMLASLLLFLILAACQEDAAERFVVVYTSVDRNYSEPLFRQFEAETGIRVKPVFDLEAAKTTGLVNRLIAEGGKTQADVFWNGEVAQMERLEQRGLLATYQPDALPDGVVIGAGGRWLEFGGRARVLIVNTDALANRQAPASILDLVSDEWPANEIVVAYPLFGTTATHAAALAAVWGTDRTLDYFARLKARGVRFVDGNSVVRDLVVSGQATVGLTDTDDACGAVAHGEPVRVVIPDQAPGQLGALVVPNSVGLMAAARHRAEAERFVGYIIGEDASRQMAAAGWFHISGHRVIAMSDCGLPETLVPMPLQRSAEPQVLMQKLRHLIVR
jgi:iron(III) transport system substrate-binding protein